MNNFDFDLGIGSNRSKSLNEQKNKSNPSFSSSYSYQSNPKTTTTPSWQPGKPSWTHQPAPSSTGITRSELGGPASMVGDIFGKSWNSTSPAHTQTQTQTQTQTPNIGIGVVNKNPNLFGDLVSSALGSNKTTSNAPLKSASAKSSFSMGGMMDSLPKSSNGNVGKNGGSFGSSQSFGGSGIGSAGYGGNSVNKSSSVGGGSMRGIGGGVGVGVGVGMGMGSSKDPFGSLVDFSSKPMSGGGGGGGSVNNSSANLSKPVSGGGGGSVNNSSKPMSGGGGSMWSEDLGFGDFQNASKSSNSSFGSGNNDFWGSNNSGSVPKMDSFTTQNAAAPVQSRGGGDSFDMFFSSSVPAGGSGGVSGLDNVVGGQEFSGGDDWGLDSEFGGGHDDGGNTTEIEGLPPPPAGVSASTAKVKGLDNYKQGQFADAIKWLSWAEVLLQKAGVNAGSVEVLTCRASCYKEVGEYKKAVADCTKVLDNDGTNVAVLVQRALLYESMEKYRLGADDLRTVMKLDPANRVARSTIHRLNKMAD